MQGCSWSLDSVLGLRWWDMRRDPWGGRKLRPSASRTRPDAPGRPLRLARHPGARWGPEGRDKANTAPGRAGRAGRAGRPSRVSRCSQRRACSWVGTWKRGMCGRRRAVGGVGVGLVVVDPYPYPYRPAAGLGLSVSFCSPVAGGGSECLCVWRKRSLDRQQACKTVAGCRLTVARRIPGPSRAPGLQRAPVTNAPPPPALAPVCSLGRPR
ncbi:hypothetical protein BDV95DRAFT_239016 [Massariosphaeria phaeospora]|uniref:Uncharacterized protein n=1 Tax=Massariosphaeria phaeospora TaxID=100035 RepID=A0A7C8IL01_9PLEO|nr:hypothetical protein BDV95DRAFT_239016 [Massariosphaeria phaeospora]